MEQHLEWIESGGGPLLFAPRSVVAQWHGNTPSTPGAVTDYQRACAVTDEIDVIYIGASQALVLGDEPDRTSLIARSPNSVLILRWRWAKSEQSLLSALNPGEIDRLSSKEDGAFNALADEYLLFDSAYSGAEITRALRVSMVGGVYSFDTFEFRPDADTCALVHRLRMKK